MTPTIMLCVRRNLDAGKNEMASWRRRYMDRQLIYIRLEYLGVFIALECSFKNMANSGRWRGREVKTRNCIHLPCRQRLRSLRVSGGQSFVTIVISGGRCTLAVPSTMLRIQLTAVTCTKNLTNSIAELVSEISIGRTPRYLTRAESTTSNHFRHRIQVVQIFRNRSGPLRRTSSPIHRGP